MNVNVNKRSVFSKYKLDQLDTKSTILTRSLLWMALGLVLIVLVSWISMISPEFLKFVTRFSFGTSWMVVWLLNIALIFSLFFTVNNTKINILVPITLYVLFAFYEGFFITSLLVFSGSVDLVKDLMLYMMIPAAVFAIMGILGYFNIINFAKLIPFMTFGFIALLILGLVLIFTGSTIIEKFYFFLAAALFIVWIGFDLQMIMRSQEAMPMYSNKKEINRLSFMFGINLFIDFVRLLELLIRMFRS